MSSRETLARLVQTWSEERVRQLLDYAEFLSLKQEQAEWQRSGEAHFAQCYGPDEPDYGEAPATPGAES